MDSVLQWCSSLLLVRCRVAAEPSNISAYDWRQVRVIVAALGSDRLLPNACIPVQRPVHPFQTLGSLQDTVSAPHNGVSLHQRDHQASAGGVLPPPFTFTTASPPAAAITKIAMVTRNNTRRRGI
jgi:hypothetical protein